MSKPKNKKIKKVKTKKLKPKKASRKNLGKRIKVKVIKKEKPENVFGSILPEVKNSDPYLDLDFSAFKEEDKIAEVIREIKNEQIEPAYIQESAEEIFKQPEEGIEQLEEEVEEISTNENNQEPFIYLSLRQKNIIMYIAVCSIMVVLVVFWFFSVKQSLSQSIKNVNILNSQESNALLQELGGVKQDFTNITNQVQDNAQILQEFSNQVKNQVIENQLKNTIIDQVKDKLENSNLNQNINSTK
ncbi:MAG: hypothetical protein A2Y82_03860 [Candidatus Buchananbacteria bacterium RBG_13_36_9]|uniref:Uncharacterized protein n=1 Tax=Candidatus Buchananbacteria bacterium RBG_13_36_9 TaxID=1797530 RepID=A0A1G1XPP4_9BACT|nr:MAG: hypothetical protein A2Y82_03860 [Candidatus Buchananbacteria bacterium RBG_13_36_9]